MHVPTSQLRVERMCRQAALQEPAQLLLKITAVAKDAVTAKAREVTGAVGFIYFYFYFEWQPELPLS